MACGNANALRVGFGLICEWDKNAQEASYHLHAMIENGLVRIGDV